MNKQTKILILNTGGTFNKYYEPISGKLIVSNSNKYIKSIFNKSFKANKKPKIEGILFKDSLEITIKDREKLIKKIIDSKFDKIIIVHGTDTMDITAESLHNNIKNKQIILVGAMKPYTIEPIEATSNLMMAYGFLLSSNKDGVLISMHGLIKNYSKIKKNRSKGVFICQ